MLNKFRFKLRLIYARLFQRHKLVYVQTTHNGPMRYEKMLTKCYPDLPAILRKDMEYYNDTNVYRSSNPYIE